MKFICLQLVIFIFYSSGNAQQLKEESKCRELLIELKQRAAKDSSYILKDSIFNVELALEKIIGKKRGANTAYFEFEEAEFQLEKLIDELDESTCILKYEFILDSLILFEIHPTTTKVYFLGNAKTVKPIMENSYELVSNPQSNLDSLKKRFESTIQF